MDPLASVTNERLGEVVSELKNEISNLNTEITTNLNVSMRDLMREMFKEFLGKPDSPKVDLAPAVDDLEKGNTLPSTDLVKANGKANANPEAKDSAGGTSTSGKPLGVYASVPSEQVYTSVHQHVSLPHITNMGAPPKLDPKDFPNWQYSMCSHMSSCCVFLIDILEQGFTPQDPHNMTPNEKANHQLNATAMHMIQTAAGPNYTTHIRMCTTAKQCWENLHNLLLGNKRIQLSKYEGVQDEADEFVMGEDETPEDLYRILTALAITLKDFGFEKISDSWIKRKFLKAITPLNQCLAQTI